MWPKGAGRVWPFVLLTTCPHSNDVLAQESLATTSASSAQVDAVVVIDRVISDIKKLMVTCESDLMELR